MVKSKSIKVQGKDISIINQNESDYISLTDLCKGFDGGNALIEKWLTTKNTIEYLAAWESINNKDFNSPEIGGIISQAGSNKFYMSVKKWIELTNAVGIVAKAGRYGGTYAHKDIALKFGAYLSPAFELYINKEFQRLKEAESNVYNIEWNFKRVLTKINYQLHTDAIQQNIIPKMSIQKKKEWLVYAEEADILNVALFGCTAKQWRDANPQRHLKGENIRDTASINELAVLANMESLNSVMIKQGISKPSRFEMLQKEASEQLKSLNQVDYIKSLKHTSSTTYPLALEDMKPEKLSQFNKDLEKGLGWNPKENE